MGDSKKQNEYYPPSHKTYINICYHKIVMWVLKLILKAPLTKPTFLKMLFSQVILYKELEDIKFKKN